jgi:hypothetical protein
MTTFRFLIGDAFPASDSVARFISVLAMMSNDWLRLMNAMLAIQDFHEDAEGLRIMSFRQQAALQHEAAEFIADARKRFPEVDAFIDDLGGSAQDACARVVSGVDPKSPHFHGEWLANHRNVTFHYPKMHPEAFAHGGEELGEALKAAAGLESTISMEDTFGSVRFIFADEVVVQWFPEEEIRVVVGRLREAALDLAGFVQQAVQGYLESRPPGTFVVE